MSVIIADHIWSAPAASSVVNSCRAANKRSQTVLQSDQWMLYANLAQRHPTVRMRQTLASPCGKPGLGKPSRRQAASRLHENTAKTMTATASRRQDTSRTPWTSGMTLNDLFQHPFAASDVSPSVLRNIDYSNLIQQKHNISNGMRE